MSVLGSLIRPVRSWLLAAPPNSARATLQLVREDFWTHGSEWSRPGFQALAAHRLGAWLPHAPRLARLLLRPVYRALYVVSRNVYGIELSATTVVGRRLRFPHQSGIVIHPHARLGDDCVVRQNVTIGATTLQRIDVAPVLGDRVEIGAGASIIGRVTVGDDARIGPNAVVMTSVAAGATVFAPRPRTVTLPPRRPMPAPAPRADVAAPREVRIAPPVSAPAVPWSTAALVRDAG
jgi:serine O-acetyltransferase